MEIEDMGELKSFETMPTEGTLYLSAVCYGNSGWTGGPSGMNKEYVLTSLRAYGGVEKARIYTVKVPLVVLPY